MAITRLSNGGDSASGSSVNAVPCKSSRIKCTNASINRRSLASGDADSACTSAISANSLSSEYS